MDNRNARFWAHLGESRGWVKVTLRPGQVLDHHMGGPDDEGWWAQGVYWHHEGDHVRREWYTDGADCDGRMSTGGEARCGLAELAALPAESRRWSGTTLVYPARPQWTPADKWQRDHAAEAMGY